ncbi:MAG: universal stress protein [Candidatus Bathyarchaeota archaeon]
MSVFEKILVPLDGSECSFHALEKAIHITKKFDSKITLMNVYSISIFRLTPTQVFESLKELRNSGEAVLEEGIKKAKSQDLQVKTIIKEGHTVQKIVETAKENNFDLIVMGARGLSTFKQILLGSVSHGVTAHASCPVLIVK